MQYIGISDIEEKRGDYLSSDDKDLNLNNKADVLEHEQKAISLMIFTMAGATEINGIQFARYINNLEKNNFISRFNTHSYLSFVVCYCVSNINNKAKVVI